MLIVVRGTTHRRDLQALRAYIADVRRCSSASTAGPTILEAGLKPDVVLGDMDSAGDEALRSGAELIVHAYPDGHAPGRSGSHRMGLEHTVIPAPGTSQDVAMLLAFEKGALLIVSVGAHFNLTDFDKNCAGMSSTFLTRLRWGRRWSTRRGEPALQPRHPGAPSSRCSRWPSSSCSWYVLSTSPLANLVELVWLKIRVWLGI